MTVQTTAQSEREPAIARDAIDRLVSSARNRARQARRPDTDGHVPSPYHEVYVAVEYVSDADSDEAARNRALFEAAATELREGGYRASSFRTDNAFHPAWAQSAGTTSPLYPATEVTDRLQIIVPAIAD